MSYTTTVRIDRELRPPRRGFGFGSGLMLAAFVGIAFVVAGTGAIAAVSGVDGFYGRMAHVAWTPPNWAFGAAWTVLYAAMGVAEWLVWRRRGAVNVGTPLALYTAQLAVNALWAPVFFGAHDLLGAVSLWAGLAVILVLDVLVTVTAVAFWRVSRTAAVLLVPYLAWILFATTLNWGDALLNAVG